MNISGISLDQLDRAGLVLAGGTHLFRFTAGVLIRDKDRTTLGNECLADGGTEASAPPYDDRNLSL